MVFWSSNISLLLTLAMQILLYCLPGMRALEKVRDRVVTDHLLLRVDFITGCR